MTNTTKLDDVLDRIKKLLALSKSSNEHEAASAAAQAQALMAKYQIEDAQLRADDPEALGEPIEKIVLDDRQRSVVSWKGQIARGVSKSLGARSWWGKDRELIILGRASAVRTATYMYQYLVREIDRLAQESRGDRRYRNAFRVGAAVVVAERLTSQLEEQTKVIQATAGASTNALIVRDGLELATAFKNLGVKIKSFSLYTSSAEGREAGRAAGAKIHLGGGRPALGAGSMTRTR